MNPSTASSPNGLLQDTQPPVVIIIDDESMVTTSVATLLKIDGAEYGGPFDITTFNNPLQAVEALQSLSSPPDVVICDYLMPEKNGIEVFTTLRTIFSETAFILLTGYADKENAIKAINEVGIYRYLEKPWDNHQLLLAIQAGVERAQLMKQLKLRIQQLEVAQLALAKVNLELEERVSERTQALSAALDSLSAIVDNTADGIITLDKNGAVLRMNPISQQWLHHAGLLPQTAEGSDISAFIAHPIGEFLTPHKTENLNEALNSKVPILFEATFAGQVEVEAHAAPLDDNLGFVLVLRDIGQRKQLERMRDDFVATLTHDMRTPLLAGIQTLKLFGDGTLGPVSVKQAEILPMLTESQSDLLELVNTLLEIYRYEAGKQQVYLQPFCLNEATQQAVKTLDSLAQERQQTLTTNLPTGACSVVADKMAIKRVMTNLIGNAIRYTPVGGKIEVKLQAEDGYWFWQIQDNGRGIPQADIGQLFERFVQGTSKHRNTGSGLGLYLSRMIIESHQGRIGVESTEGVGSRFVFTLPQPR